MVFKTIGNKSNPVILFFHAMGVIGESSMPVAEKMKEKYYCRNALMQTYIHGNFPAFEGFNHMQYQIQNPEGFARMLKKIIETDRLPELVF